MGFQALKKVGSTYQLIIPSDFVVWFWISAASPYNPAKLIPWADNFGGTLWGYRFLIRIGYPNLTHFGTHFIKSSIIAHSQ